MQINFKTKTPSQQPVGIEPLDEFTIVVKKELIEGDDCFKCCLQVGDLDAVIGFVSKRDSDFRLKLYDMVNSIKEHEALFLKLVHDWRELNIIEAKAKWDKTIIEDNMRKQLQELYIKKRNTRENSRLRKKMAVEYAVDAVEGKLKCCFCGKSAGKYGHNAMPVKADRCCENCNASIVVPARLKKMEEKK